MNRNLHKEEVGKAFRKSKWPSPVNVGDSPANVENRYYDDSQSLLFREMYMLRGQKE